MADTIIIETPVATVLEVSGLQGPQGATGATGSTGAVGQGVPTGGTTGQVLRKASGANYDTEWGAGGSGSVTYGTTAGTSCEGNDARLFNSRAPNAHASSHATGGSDAVSPNSIGAMYALETRLHSFYSTSTYALAEGRNVQLDVSFPANNAAGTIILPRLIADSAQNGDDLVISASGFGNGQTLTIQRYVWTGSSYINSLESVVNSSAGGLWRFRLLYGVWSLQTVATHTHQATEISDSTSTGRSVLTATDAAAARTAIGAQASGSYATATHSHVIGDVTGLQTALDGKQTSGSYAAASHTHAPSEVGLGNVSNTAQVTSVTGTAPIVSSGGTTPALSISAATTSAAGSMSSADKTKLDGIATSANNYTHPNHTGDVTSSGDGATTIANNAVTNAKLAQVATSTLKGRATAATGNVEDLTATQVRTLLNVADGATANSADATLLARANHTGTQSVSTITGLGGAATLSVGTTTGTVAAGDDSRFHTRSHAITSTSDHTAGNWSVFYSNGSGQVTELGLGAANTILTSNGATSAPSFAAAAASGATNLWIPASAWIPRTTTGCGVDSREQATNKVNTDELLFDTATEEYAQALVVMPSNYNNSTVTARFYWTAASGSGGVAWGLRGRAYADDDALDAAQGTGQVVTDTFLLANDMHVTSATSAITLAGTPAANRPVQYEIYRSVANASDTLAVDARLLGVEIIFN